MGTARLCGVATAKMSSAAKFCLTIVCLVILAGSPAGVSAEKLKKSSLHVGRHFTHRKDSASISPNFEPDVPPLQNPEHGEGPPEAATTTQLNNPSLELENKHTTPSTNMEMDVPPLDERKHHSNHMSTISPVRNENTPAPATATHLSKDPQGDPRTTASTLKPHEAETHHHLKKESTTTKPPQNKTVRVTKETTTVSPTTVTIIPQKKQITQPSVQEKMLKNATSVPDKAELKGLKLDQEMKKLLPTTLPKIVRNSTVVSTKLKTLAQDSSVLKSDETQLMEIVQHMDIDASPKTPSMPAPLKTTPILAQGGKIKEDNTSSASESRVNVVKIKMPESNDERGKQQLRNQEGKKRRRQNPNVHDQNASTIAVRNSRKSQRVFKQAEQPLQQQEEGDENKTYDHEIEIEVVRPSGKKRMNRPQSGSKQPSRRNKAAQPVKEQQGFNDEIKSTQEIEQREIFGDNNRKRNRASKRLRQNSDRNEAKLQPTEELSADDETMPIQDNRRTENYEKIANARRNYNSPQSIKVSDKDPGLSKPYDDDDDDLKPTLKNIRAENGKLLRNRNRNRASVASRKSKSDIEMPEEIDEEQSIVAIQPTEKKKNLNKTLRNQSKRGREGREGGRLGSRRTSAGEKVDAELSEQQVLLDEPIQIHKDSEVVNVEVRLNKIRDRLSTPERPKSGKKRSKGRVASPVPLAEEPEVPEDDVNIETPQKQPNKRRMRPSVRKQVPSTPKPTEAAEDNQLQAPEIQENTRLSRRRMRGRFVNRRQQTTQESDYPESEISEGFVRKKRNLATNEKIFHQTIGQPEYSETQEAFQKRCANCISNRNCNKMELKMCNSSVKNHINDDYGDVNYIHLSVKLYGCVLFLVLVGVLVYVCLQDRCHQDYIYLGIGLAIMCTFYLAAIVAVMYAQGMLTF